MANAERSRRWLVLLSTGLVLIALGAIFLVLGLQDADRLASTIGALAGVAGLGLSFWSATPSARSRGAEQADGRPDGPKGFFFFNRVAINGNGNNVGDEALKTKRRHR